MEGPFINPKYKGAQNPDYIFKPDIELFNACKNIKMVTIAPELPGSKAFIESCPAVVSLGHSDADYDTAKGAFGAGVRCLTHTFNAMAGIHHRAPGAIVAAAENENVYAQLIADGTHVHPAVVRMAVKLFGTDRVIFISDSMCATGLQDGDYSLGGQQVKVVGGVAKLLDGHIAGSTSTLFDVVKSAIGMGIPEWDAVKMATANPAELMGLNKGKIEIGYDADFILVDNDFNLVKVFKNTDFC
jgi:N-acetylglucosamine-6-phosphate deacetylase